MSAFIDFSKQVANTIKKGELSVIASYRYYSVWKESFNSNKSTISERLPWLTFSAIDFLKGFIDQTHCVFEFGGGGSTLFFLDKASAVVTVEHDRQWFNELSKIVGDNTKWESNFIEPVPSEKTGDINNPFDYCSDDPMFEKYSFKDYVAKIDCFPNESFDIILIDGRARTSCIHHSLTKVKKGGLLIIDNAEREYYFTQNSSSLQANFQILQNNWGPVPFSKSFSKTAIWQRK